MKRVLSSNARPCPRKINSPLNPQLQKVRGLCMRQMSRPAVNLPVINIRSPSFDSDTGIQAMQDREGLLSSDADREKHWQTAEFENPQGSRRHTILAAVKEYFHLITIFLLLIIITLQASIWHSLQRPSCAQQVGTEHLAPDFPTEVIKWAADPSFVPLNATAFLSPRVQAKWETLMPSSANTAFPADGLVYNSTSVTHQLHCVYIMGKIFSAVLTKSEDIPEPEDYEAHFLHCVDYMRQAAMCAGDLAIEPRGETPGERGAVSLENAFNGRHVCKDYGMVREFLEGEIREGKRNILPLDD